MFTVEITRTGSKTSTFDVDESTSEIAIEKALQQAYNHDFGADSSSEYEVVHVGRHDGLKNFQIRLIEDQEEGDTITVFSCQAEDFDHAVEQADNAYPDCEVLGTVDGRILAESTLELYGIRVFTDLTHGEGWVAFSEDDTSIYPTKEQALIEATKLVRAKLKDSFDQQVEAWLMQRVTDGNLNIRGLCKLAVRYGRMNPEEWEEEMDERLQMNSGEGC